MQKLKTTEDILNDRTLFTQEQADVVRTNVKEQVAKIKVGRKPAIEGCSRNKVIKVSDVTKEALQYAYSLGLIVSIEDIKILEYIKTHGLTLSRLKKA